MKEEDKDDAVILGGSLQFIYEMSKEILNTPKNESVFEFLETVKDKVRTPLENDPFLKNMYKGADVVKYGKAFVDSIRDLFKKNKWFEI